MGFLTSVTIQSYQEKAHGGKEQTGMIESVKITKVGIFWRLMIKSER
jgi:hypothetical protein